ncbi:hypothetical protein BDR06DRAFT_581819 [Suillus hirtellus]|nr:hypothetical protein BDR06DRAFT_581819 [Suillus hirtellus]
MLNWLATLLVLMLTQVLQIEVPRQLIEICNKRNDECDCRYLKFLGILSLREVSFECLAWPPYACLMPFCGSKALFSDLDDGEIIRRHGCGLRV